MSQDKMRKLIESIDQTAGPADQVDGLEVARSTKFLGKPYKRDEHPFDDRLVGEEEEVTEDLVAELKQAYEDYVRTTPAAETTYRARLTFRDGRTEVRQLSKGEVKRLKDSPHVASVKVLSTHDKSGARIDEVANGHTIEAYGVRGMQSKPWRKTFKSYDELANWSDKYDAEVYGTRDLDSAKKDNLSPTPESKGENRAHYDRIRQKNVMPNIDRDKYQERDGLEGPFQFKSGKILYYDPKEGKYWDPHTDFYLDHDEFEAYSSGKLDEYGTVTTADSAVAPAVNTKPATSGVKVATKPGDAPDPTAANPSTQAAPTPAKPGDAPNPTANNPSTQSQAVVDKLGKIAKNPSLAGQLKALLMKAESIDKELKMKSKDFMYEAESKYPAAPPSKNPEVKLANGKTKADKHPRMGDGFYGKNSEGKLRFFAGKEGEAKAKEYAAKKDVKESQLDELSPNTLKSYRSKAADDYHTRSKRARNLPLIADPDDPAEIDAAYDQADIERAKAKKRATGMGKAKLKLDQKMDEASDAAMARAGERDWHASLAEPNAAPAKQFYIWTMSKGKKKKIAGPFPSEEAANKSAERQWGEGVCSGTCESVYHEGMFTDIVTEEIVSSYRVIHPDPERSDEVGIEITDVPNQTMFGQKWENVSDELQSEFGFDAPVFGRGESPKRKIKMTFAQYIDLINDYISGQ